MGFRVRAVQWMDDLPGEAEAAGVADEFTVAADLGVGLPVGVQGVGLGASTALPPADAMLPAEMLPDACQIPQRPRLLMMHTVLVRAHINPPLVTTTAAAVVIIIIIIIRYPWILRSIHSFHHHHHHSAIAAAAVAFIRLHHQALCRQCDHLQCAFLISRIIISTIAILIRT
mgnify:CR=1 FL=1